MLRSNSYSGGFISDVDMLELDRFHAVEAEQKMSVIARLRDERLKCLATRIVYEEWPTALPSAVREQIDAEVAEAAACRD